MTNDPYRTPGEALTDEERRGRWLREFQYLQLCNVVGRSPEDLKRMRDRTEVLRQLLWPPQPVKPMTQAQADELLQKLGLKR